MEIKYRKVLRKVTRRPAKNSKIKLGTLLILTFSTKVRFFSADLKVENILEREFRPNIDYTLNLKRKKNIESSFSYF